MTLLICLAGAFTSLRFGHAETSGCAGTIMEREALSPIDRDGGCFDPTPLRPTGSALYTVPALGPETRFECKGDGCDLPQAQWALAALRQAMGADTRRLGVRPVLGTVFYELAPLPTAISATTTGGWHGATHPLLRTISIAFDPAKLPSAADYDLAARHEYVHALQDSLGLFRESEHVTEGLAYWVQLTAVHLADRRLEDTWRNLVARNWPAVQAMAVRGRAASWSPPVATGLDSQIWAALHTGVVLDSLGGQRYLRVLVTAHYDGEPADDVLRREGFPTMAQFSALANEHLADQDGGLGYFTMLARRWGPI